MNLNKKTRHFKHCPVCSRPLEIHPISERSACFLHGDVIVREDEIVFRLSPNFD